MNVRSRLLPGFTLQHCDILVPTGKLGQQKSGHPDRCRGDPHDLWAGIPSLPFTDKVFPQGTWELEEEVCNPQGRWNKSRARKETSLQVPFTKGTFLLGSRALWKWGFLGLREQVRILRNNHKRSGLGSWQFVITILIMKKEMEAIRKFPRIGYAGTEGRQLQTFNTWATFIHSSPNSLWSLWVQSPLCHIKVFVELGYMFGTTQGVSFNGHQEKASFIKQRYHM